MEDSKLPDFKEKFYLDCGFATRALHAGARGVRERWGGVIRKLGLKLD